MVAQARNFVHSALTPAIERHEPETISGVLVDDPESGRFDTDAYVRVPVGRIAPHGVRGGDRRRRAAAARARSRRSRRRCAAGSARCTRRASTARASGATRSAASTTWRCSGSQPPRGALRVANGLRDVVLRGTAPLPPTSARAARRLPARRHARGSRRRGRRVPRLRALAPARGVGRERRVHARAVRRRCCAGCRSAGRTAGAIAIVLLFATMTRFEPSVLRASALAVVALGVVVRRPARVERARAGARGDRAARWSTRSCCTRSGSGCRAARARASRCSRVRCAPGCPGPRGCAARSRCRSPRRSASRRCCSRRSGSVPVVTPLANLLAAPAAEAVGVYGMLAERDRRPGAAARAAAAAAVGRAASRGSPRSPGPARRSASSSTAGGAGSCSRSDARPRPRVRADRAGDAAASVASARPCTAEVRTRRSASAPSASTCGRARS